MTFLVERWRRIGTRLYLALGFAVALTLLSSAVGVYYFEQSGDLNYRARSESVPILGAAAAAAQAVERLTAVGLAELGTDGSPVDGYRAADVDAILGELEAALARPGGSPGLRADARAVQDAAYAMASAIDSLTANRENVSNVESSTVTTLGNVPTELASFALRVSLAENRNTLEPLQAEFDALTASGLSQESVQAAIDLLTYRGSWLDYRVERSELTTAFDESRVALDSAVGVLADGSAREADAALGLAVASFDRGRLLLATISIVSVAAAMLVAWLWVGNGVLRRLSRMSERMRGMASGDLATPVPEVGGDEIGQLADALEVFRQHALEVQRLNLVEQLYQEVREANAELQRMQARLVAQEKLAALGELVSGVAHEISNPLNFVRNFSEGASQLHAELAEMLQNYRGAMASDDVDLLDDITREMQDSLERVISNGGRALAIVERMQSLGVEGRPPQLANLNATLRTAVLAGCDGYEMTPIFDLDDSIGDIPLVVGDFGEAVVNLVTNACYAMQEKQRQAGDGYEPKLLVSSRLAGDLVELRVRDNGTGISDDVVGQIFNPFFSTRDGVLGAGLGLPIAADVARRSGGDLQVNAVFGDYAEFLMTLPVDGAELTETAMEAATAFPS